jgi:hypothetical protein
MTCAVFKMVGGSANLATVNKTPRMHTHPVSAMKTPIVAATNFVAAIIGMAHQIDASLKVNQMMLGAILKTVGKRYICYKSMSPGRQTFPNSTISNPAGPCTLTSCPTNTILLLIGVDKKLYIHEMGYHVACDNGGMVWGITMMPDGNILAIGIYGKLYTHDALSANYVKEPDVGWLQVRGITMMPDGRILASIGMDGKLYIKETLDSYSVKVPDIGGEFQGIALINT